MAEDAVPGSAPAAPSEAGGGPPAAPADPDLARLVASLDDDPDPLHLDFTPAVHALIDRGCAGALAVVDLLDAPDELTRLHAERVVEGAAMAYHGWVAGRGYADGALGEERVRALLAANGGYSYDAAPEVRRAAVPRWRHWLEERALPPPETRRRGAVGGRFRAPRAHLSAGQPVWVELEMENDGTAPLTFESADDDRGSPPGARLVVTVEDAGGRRVCDGASRLLEGPGASARLVTVAPGEPYRERLLLNPLCEALLEPGRYRVTLTRVLAAAGLDALERDPAITTELSLEISPYDQARLGATLRVVREEITSGVEPGFRVRYFEWVCHRLRCDCPALDERSRDGVLRWMEGVQSALPPSVPSHPCPEG